MYTYCCTLHLIRPQVTHRKTCEETACAVIRSCGICHSFTGQTRNVSAGDLQVYPGVHRWFGHGVDAVSYPRTVRTLHVHSAPPPPLLCDVTPTHLQAPPITTRGAVDARTNNEKDLLIMQLQAELAASHANPAQYVHPTLSTTTDSECTVRLHTLLHVFYMQATITFYRLPPYIALQPTLLAHVTYTRIHPNLRLLLTLTP
jgi:hypothetical protein